MWLFLRYGIQIMRVWGRTLLHVFNNLRDISGRLSDSPYYSACFSLPSIGKMCVICNTCTSFYYAVPISLTHLLRNMSHVTSKKTQPECTSKSAKTPFVNTFGLAEVSSKKVCRVTVLCLHRAISGLRIIILIVRVTGQWKWLSRNNYTIT